MMREVRDEIYYCKSTVCQLFWMDILVKLVEWSAITMNPHKMSVKARYGMYFVGSNSDLYSA